jgi:methylated-DNA-[protein]-cysteine S-methyltransferase
MSKIQISKIPAEVQKSLEIQFSEYVAGKRKRFDLKKLHIHSDLRELTATPLQKMVWKELLHIPYGTTVTYSELAQRVGNPKAVRAVASAVARNPLYIIIPCHRVLPKPGLNSVSKSKIKVDIGNYALGRDMKKILLQLEGAILN